MRAACAATRHEADDGFIGAGALEVVVRLAEEVVADRFAPTWRSLLVRRLTERGLSQTDVAALLGVSQSAVSKHLMGRLGGDERLAHEPRLVETVERVAQGLADGTMPPFQALLEAEALVRAFEDRGPICRIHEEEMPALQGLGCDICIRVGDTTLLPEQSALADMRAALRILEATPGLAPLLPHVGTNLARAIPGAQDVGQVAAVPGRLFVLHGTVKVPAAPEFGVSRHMSRLLLAVHRADARLLACINLAPEAGLLAAAAREGMRVARVAPDVERAPDALHFEGAVPDVFHHEGAFGIEPQAYLVAEDATRLALRVRTLLASLPR
jgi:predicted fused transcriptional regulator/phosphomethylpyrimidine kinase/predicted transcriptional regulator